MNAIIYMLNLIEISCVLFTVYLYEYLHKTKTFEFCNCSLRHRNSAKAYTGYVLHTKYLYLYISKSYTFTCYRTYIKVMSLLSPNCQAFIKL